MTQPSEWLPTLESLRAAIAEDQLAKWINFSLDAVGENSVTAHMLVEKRLIAPNGFLQGTFVVGFADITCGLGTASTLRDPNKSFATMELKSNFLGTATTTERLVCLATARHLGSRSQVWDAEVRREGADKTMALFRCTQMIF
ncbi:hypothetical protein FACS1894206_05420 [Deltaproteobacteria bacterium]|nr:hypothetical protein FACS1894206_05420 [Deltaproteobacteria bacterium]